MNTVMRDADAVDRVDVEPVSKEERRELYKPRVKIFPKRASGTFRTLKWWVMGVTLAIYYLTPWIRWDRGPYAPDQAVLVDLANRRFYFFFIEIWPQEFYYVAGLLIMAGVGLFLVTSVLGRAWCGYTCPQTVWVDLFLVVERFIEGDRNARIMLDRAPWTANKIAKRVAKHAIWLVIAVATGGAWIFYFADAPWLAQALVTGEAPFIAYSTVAVLTGTTYVFAGFMREQVCIYMCPWPRIQSAMFDENTLIVTYNDWRGEPRGHLAKNRDPRLGDCVDCKMCVAVCPQGIDIRDGQQLECISCALCIDACNGIMDKVGKPRGLISYTTLTDFEERAAGKQAKLTWREVVRPRTMIYAAVWALAGLAMLAVLASRDRLEVNVLHDRNPLFVQLSDGGVRNGYTVKILNMVPQPRSFELSLDDLDGGTLSVAGNDAAPAESVTVEVGADRVRSLRVYVTVEPAYLRPGRTEFKFEVEDVAGEEDAEYEAAFHAPEE
ncbi:MAG TPA: cytochrome c oxidase accessory protein CcoG [Hyphomicrobiales bacterium]|nr:cytochrome c oxidase accessory protein CcoG [Hyphomicrobiales bacterium]